MLFCSNSAEVVVVIIVATRDSLIISLHIGISALAFVVKALELFFLDTFGFFHDANNVDEANDIAAAKEKPDSASKTVIQRES